MVRGMAVSKAYCNVYIVANKCNGIWLRQIEHLNNVCAFTKTWVCVNSTWKCCRPNKEQLFASIQPVHKNNTRVPSPRYYMLNLISSRMETLIPGHSTFCYSCPHLDNLYSALKDAKDSCDYFWRRYLWALSSVSYLDGFPEVPVPVAVKIMPTLKNAIIFVSYQNLHI